MEGPTPRRSVRVRLSVMAKISVEPTQAKWKRQGDEAIKCDFSLIPERLPRQTEMQCSEPVGDCSAY